jgi:hypothetical protein
MERVVTRLPSTVHASLIAMAFPNLTSSGPFNLTISGGTDRKVMFAFLPADTDEDIVLTFYDLANALLRKGDAKDAASLLFVTERTIEVAKGLALVSIPGASNPRNLDAHRKVVAQAARLFDVWDEDARQSAERELRVGLADYYKTDPLSASTAWQMLSNSQIEQDGGRSSTPATDVSSKN